jgi:hypothetical protein
MKTRLLELVGINSTQSSITMASLLNKGCCRVLLTSMDSPSCQRDENMEQLRFMKSSRLACCGCIHNEVVTTETLKEQLLCRRDPSSVHICSSERVFVAEMVRDHSLVCWHSEALFYVVFAQSEEEHSQQGSDCSIGR